jgi:hypothetical protein
MYGVDVVRMCGVDIRKWMLSGCVEWILESGCCQDVWSGYQKVDVVRMCGVDIRKWMLSGCVEWISESG